jgi:hypothetical protein
MAGIMRKPVIVSVLLTAVCISLFPSAVVAQSGRTGKAEGNDRNIRRTFSPRKKLENVRLTSLYLRNGRLVSGRVVSEDSNKIIVAEIVGSQIMVNTYGVRELELKTRSVKIKLEFEHYEELAVYFAGRTGDFRDDPDDFIQAIRFYEKAKYLLADASPNIYADKIREIEKKIDAINAERKVWIREVKSRTELKQLELQATVNERLKELQDENTKYKEQLETIIADMDDIRDNFDILDRNISWNIQRLEEEAIANQYEVDQLRRRRAPVYLYDNYNRPRVNYSARRPRSPRRDQNQDQDQDDQDTDDLDR